MDARDDASALSRKQLLASMLGFDTRSLAAFRIAFAAVHLHSLTWLWSDVALFYSDEGLLPRSAHPYSELPLSEPRAWQWSLLHLDGQTVFCDAIVATFAAALLMLLVGYRTRVAVATCWACQVSLSHRNPYVTNAFDMYSAGLLLFCLVGNVPLGAKYSVDGARASNSTLFSVQVVSTAGAFALRGQVLLLYTTAVLNKEFGSWVRDGDAVCAVWAAPQMMRPPLAPWLLEIPGACHVASRIGIYGEALVAVLILVPHGLAQGLACGLQLLLHLGVFSTMMLDEIPFVNLAVACLFATPSMWDALEHVLLKTRRCKRRHQKVPCTSSVSTLPAYQHAALPSAGYFTRVMQRLRSLPPLALLLLALHVHASRTWHGVYVEQPLLPLPLGHLQAALGLSTQYFAVFSRVGRMEPSWPAIRGTPRSNSGRSGGNSIDSGVQGEVDAFTSGGLRVDVTPSGQTALPAAKDDGMPKCASTRGAFNGGCVYRTARWRKLWEALDFHAEPAPQPWRVVVISRLGLHLCKAAAAQHGTLETLAFVARTPHPHALGSLDCLSGVFTISNDFQWSHHIPGIVGGARAGWQDLPPTASMKASVINGDADSMEHEVRSRLGRDGYAVLCWANRTATWSDDGLTSALSFLGHPYHDDTGSAVLTITPEADPNADAALTLAGLEWHHECAYEPTPPRYLALYCRRNDDEEGGHLLLCDPQGVISALSDAAHRAMRRVRFNTTLRPDNPPMTLLRGTAADATRDGDATNVEPWYFSAITTSYRGARRGFFYPADASDQEEGWALLDELVPRLLHCPGARRLRWRAGDLVIIDNRRILHGRTPLSGVAGDGHREIAHLRIR